MGLSRWDNPRGSFCGRNRWYYKLLKVTFYKVIGTYWDGTNNKAKLLALKLILAYVVGKRVQKIHLMSDSMLIIKLMKGLVHVQDILLNPIYIEVVLLKQGFSHIY